ncbi:glutamate receptor 2.3-like [Carex rostrata]
MVTFNTILIFLLFLSSFFVKTSELTLSIGAILDTNSRVGREQKIAIDVAIRWFNSSSQVIILNAIDLRSNNPRQAASYAQGLIQQGAQVIISTGTWPQLLSISDVSEETKVLTVSLIPSTSFRKPFLIQLSYPDSAIINCLVDLVKSYKWRQVIAVYEDDIYGTVSGTAQKLAFALEEVGTLLEYSAVFPSMDSISDPQTTILAELDRMRQCLSTVYIILRSSENLTLSLFREASTHGMIRKGSVWICGPDIITLLDSTLNTSFISNHMQGIIGIDPYIKESEPEYGKFFTEFQQAFRSEYEKNRETRFTPGAYAVRAFDGLHAVSLAANRSQLNGNTFMDNLQISNFVGLSGLVRPGTDQRMKEEGAYSIFRVINVVGKSYKEIGYWSEGFGFYKDESQLSLRGSTLPQLTVVHWPGELNKIPGGLRELKVGVPVNFPPGYGYVTYDNTTNNYSGFCIAVFNAAIDRLNSWIPFKFVNFTINGSKTYDDLIDQVYSKNYDMAIGDITITSSRSEKVSFTEPFIESGFVMIVPLKHKNPSLLLFKPFHWTLWISFAIVFICNVVAILLLEKDHNLQAGFHGPLYRQLGATFWIVGNTIFQNHGERIGSYYTKVVIISWLLVVLIVSNCFTANLSSILVTEKLTPVVDKSKVGCQNVSFVVNYVKNVLNFKDVVPTKGPEELAHAFKKGTITSAIVELPYAQIFLSKYKNYAVHGDTQMHGGFGFALQKSNPLTAELSRVILELQEDGTVKDLGRQLFLPPFYGSDATANSLDAQQSLRADAFLVLFVLNAVVVIIVVAARCFFDPGESEGGDVHHRPDAEIGVHHRQEAAVDIPPGPNPVIDVTHRPDPIVVVPLGPDPAVGVNHGPNPAVGVYEMTRRRRVRSSPENEISRENWDAGTAPLFLS